MKIKNNKILKFNEKTYVSNVWMNPGLYHLSTDILKDLPNNGSIEANVFPKLAKNKLLNAVKFKNVFWHSIDSFKDIELCSEEMRTKKYVRFFNN